MNVGHPSNLARIVALYGGSMDETGYVSKTPDLTGMREDLFAVSVTDEETKNTIEELYRRYGILLEPHGAVAWKGTKVYSGLNKNPKPGKPLYISLETAHPAKFPEGIRQILNFEPLLPPSMAGLEQKPENYFTMDNHYELLKDFILKNYK
jgi:threonine synthase